MLKKNKASLDTTKANQPLETTHRVKSRSAQQAVSLTQDALRLPKSRQMIRAPLEGPQKLAIRHRFLEGLAISCIAAALLLGLSMFSYKPARNNTQFIIFAANNLGGKVGYYAAHWLFLEIGVMAYTIPALLGYIGILLFKNRLLTFHTNYLLILCQLLGLACIIVAGCGFNMSFDFHHGLPYPGGLIGFYIDSYLSQFLGETGIRLSLTALLLTGTTLSTGVSWINICEQLVNWLSSHLLTLKHKLNLWFKAVFLRSHAASNDQANHFIEAIDAIKPYNDNKPQPLIHPKSSEMVEKAAETLPQQENKPCSPQQIQHLDLKGSFPLKQSAASKYLPPSLDLLDLPDNNQKASYTPEELVLLSRTLEAQLKDFGIYVEVVGAYPGPVITRFELKLAPGIKASRITALVTDLARSLSVVSVRIVEIIPGKSFIGLELPNRDRATVRLRELLNSAAYTETPSPLVMALGKDTEGESIVVDLAKMPHLLVAGTTGSGKSVGLNAMLLSILYRATPDQVRLIMIDPKMLELSIYEDIPHLLSPVVTDMKKAANALSWCIKEMDRRYKLMSLLGVRSLTSYNQKVETALLEGKPIIDPTFKQAISATELPKLLETLPYIVVLVDEFSDLIMVVGKKVEGLIARLAQKARAAGIHLILATQRPSVDVITGLIKANIPTRIAFQVSSGIDSRTILGQQGAEQLLGHGDMLYMAPGTGVPSRIHGAFVADEEVHRVVADLKKSGTRDYPITFGNAPEDSEITTDSLEQSDENTLYEKAVQLVIETGRASTSNVQRRLKIGYNRAAGLLEKMEKEGIVSNMAQNGKREVLVSSQD